MSSPLSSGTLDKSRIAGSLYGMLVGDAVAVPGHWFYSPAKLREDYGEITGMVAPKLHHAESMVKGMSYKGSMDIMHDKARFYQHEDNKKMLSDEEIEKRRDDHGNYVGAVPEQRVHYHASLKRGQNTANACIARLLMRYLAEKNKCRQDYYDPDEFLQRLVVYMTTEPHPDDADQLLNHNDVYLDVYLRGFFTNASKEGVALRDCAISQRDSWSIGSLDGVVMSIPIVAAYADEPEAIVIGRAVEHHMLTHRSVTVTAVVSVVVPLFLQLYHGAKLRDALDIAMEKMRPPTMTGRQMRDSYVQNRGPGNIPKHDKWLQHMLFEDESTKDLVHRLLDTQQDDQDVAGWGDRDHSRLSTACYCEQAFPIVLYLAYKYADDPTQGLLQNVMLGGHSTSRGALLGAIYGAACGEDSIPFVSDLCAKESISKEVQELVETIF